MGSRWAASTARLKAAEVIRLAEQRLQRTQIARQLGIGVASVYRVLAEARKLGSERKAAA